MKFMKSHKALCICVGIVLLLCGLYAFLLSEFAIRRIWLPIAGSCANAEMSVEKCSVSLFGEETFSASGFSMRGDGLAVSVKSVTLSTNPIAAAFGSLLDVKSLDVDGLNVDITERKTDSVPESKRGTVRNDQTAPSGLPLRIEKVSVTNFAVSWKNGNGDDIRFSDAGLSLAGLSSGRDAAVELAGNLFVSTKKATLDTTKATVNVKFKTPATLRLPESFSADIATVPARLAAAGMPDQTVGLAAGVRGTCRDDRISMETGFLSLDSDKNGKLIDLRFGGTVDAKGGTGEIPGKLRIGPSGTVDALVFAATGKEVQGFFLEKDFSIVAKEGKLTAAIAAKAGAKRLAIGSGDESMVFSSPKFDFSTTVDCDRSSILVRRGVCSVAYAASKGRTAAVLSFSGKFQPSSGDFEADMAGDFTNPALMFKSDALAGYAKLKPSLKLKGNWSGNVLSVVAQAAESDYLVRTSGKLELAADALHLDKIDMSLARTGSELVRLGVSGVIPGDGNLAGVKLKISVAKNPLSGGASTAEKTFSRSKLSLNGEIDGGNIQCKFNGGGEWNRHALDANGDVRVRIDGGKPQDVVVSMKLNSNGNAVANIGVSGKYPSFKVVSDRIDVDGILELLDTGDAQNSGVTTKSTVAATKGKADKPSPKKLEKQPEPAPLDLSGVDGLNVAFDFRNVTYTRNLNIGMSGVVGIKGNVITVDNGAYSVNGSKGTIAVSVDVGKDNGWPYEFKTGLSELDIAPIMKAVRRRAKPGVGGKIGKLEIDLAGRGFTSFDLMKRSTGSVALDAGDLAMSVTEMAKDSILNLLLLPIESVPELMSCYPAFASTNIGKTLDKYSKRIQPVLLGQDDLKFGNGRLRASIGNGRLDIRELRMSDGLVSEELVTANLVLPDGRLEMQSNMRLDNVSIPIAIGGTLAAPKPDLAKTGRMLFGNTVKDIISDPKKASDAIRDVKQILDLF